MIVTTDHVPPGAANVRVAACLASTLDGRLAHPDIPVLGSDDDRRRLEGLRAQADVLLYGAGTARADSRRRIEFRFPEIGLPVQYRLGLPVPPIVVLARTPDFDFTGPFWTTPTPKLLLHARRMTTDGGSPVSTTPHEDERPTHLPDDVTYLAIPATVNPLQPKANTHVSMGVVLTYLCRWLTEVAPRAGGLVAGQGPGHVPRVLCEGGGTIVASLMGEGLLDELFLTLTSWVAGDDTDTPLSVGGVTGAQRFALTSADVRTRSSEVFLRYRREGRDPWSITGQE